MKAMIFAAGLGSRLRPITDHIPKAMVEVGGKPVLQRTIEHCKAAGIGEIVINVHYLADVILEFLEKNQSFGITIHISDERDELLETGGGIWKAREWLIGDSPILVANADVVTNINLASFLISHQQNKGLATLAVRERDSSRKLHFDETGRLIGRWTEDKKTGKGLAFSGYHILSPEIFKYPTREGKFSITDWYLDLCIERSIYAYEHNEDLWVDIGRPEQLELANQLLKGDSLQA